MGQPTYVGVSNAAGQNLGSVASSTNAITPTLPGGAASGDRIFVIQCHAATSAGTTPTNWTVLGTKDSTVGSGAGAAGSGLRRITVYYRDYDGVWSMPSFPLTSVAFNSHWIAAVAVRVSGAGGVFNTPTIIGPSGTFNTSTTSYSDSIASFATTSNGLLIAGTCLNDAVTSTGGTLTQTGATFGAVSERADGNNASSGTWLVAGKIHTIPVTTGATATSTFALTLSAASQGETVLVQQTEFIAHTATASLAVTAGRTAAGSVPGPKTETLTDDFATENGAKWDYTSTGGDAAVVAGELHVDNGATLLSVNNYDLTGSYAYIKTITPAEFMWGISDLVSGGAIFQYDGVTTIGVATADASIAEDFTYDAVNHKWMRIRESSGTVYWEVSPNGASWTELHSGAYAIGAELPAAVVGSGVVFDNFNTPGGAALTATASLSVTATLSTAATRTHNAAASLAVTAAPSGALTLAATGNTSLAVATTASAAVTRGHNTTATLGVAATPSGATTNAGVVATALPVTASPTGTASRGQVLATDLAVTATASATVTRIFSADSTLAVTAAPTATGLNAKTIAATLPVTASPTGTANQGGGASAALAVTAGVTGTADKIIEAAADTLAVTANPTTVGHRTHNTAANLAVTATASGTAGRTAAVAATLAVSATPTAAAGKAASATASLSCVVAFTAAATVTRSASANLAVTVSFTAAATVPVRTDDSRILLINRDYRLTTVSEGPRDVIVGHDNRETRPDREAVRIGPDPRLLRMD